MEEKRRELKLALEEMQRIYDLQRESTRQRIRQDVLLGHEVATESGKQQVLEAWDTCVRDGTVATARVGSGKEEAEKEGARAPSLFFFFRHF